MIGYEEPGEAEDVASEPDPRSWLEQFAEVLPALGRE
jgi:hypothetical protein